MKKIDKKKFVIDFLDNNPIFSEAAFLEKAKNDVEEFSIGKHYFYTLSQDHDLRLIQERINTSFLSKVELNNSATAFVKGLSYFDFLEPHKNSYNFVRLDIASFFHSFRIEDLKKTFSYYFKDEQLTEENEEKLIDIFIHLVTHRVPANSKNSYCANKSILPIGFLTSPSISNILFRPIDIKIQEFCQQKEITYTRYADDMLFSSAEDMRFVHSDSFEKEISILVSLLGLRLNRHKTIKRKHTISLNGYVIQSKSNNLWTKILGPEADTLSGIRISNKKTRTIEDIIYLLNNEHKSSLDILKKLFKFKINSKYYEKPINLKLLEKYAEDQLLNKLSGYRSYLISIVKFNESSKCVSSSALKKYASLIDEIELTINKITHQKMTKA